MAKRKIQGSGAVVTGASSGIGRAIALELARHGAALVAVARREDRLRELADAVESDGGRVEIVVGDVTEPLTRERVVHTAESAFGGLDILVNNAGIGAVGLFERADPERLRQIMEVNFFAVVEMTRLALPLLKRGVKPVLVNVGSVLGHRGTPHRSEYCASKFAIQGFSEAIRAEIARHGIDVLVVSPGRTDTEFAEKVVERTDEGSWPEPPAVSAAIVARKTVRAIRSGRHEIIPHFWGRALLWLNRASPRLVDTITARYV
jgi:short-subunit dehydrogenase